MKALFGPGRTLKGKGPACMGVPFPPARQTEEKEQLFGLAPESITAAKRLFQSLELAVPLACTVLPESKYKQRYTASPTRVLKKKRLLVAILDISYKHPRSVLLSWVLAELTSGWHGGPSGLLWPVSTPVSAQGLLTLTYFEYQPWISVETFLQAPNGDVIWYHTWEYS